MQLKGAAALCDRLLSGSKGGRAMPADVMIFSAAIVAVFVMFGSVLYWGERRARTASPAIDGVKVKRRSF
jgi:hypothetical protein